MPNTDGIEKELLARAGDASIADLGTIAGAMKAIAETKQTELTARTKEREIRLELFKSAAAFLVPVVSLLALYGTIRTQNSQIESTRQQLEDTEWRDMLSSLKGTSEAVYSDPTVAPRLRSFFASRTYGDQAKSIAARLMGRLSNPEGFADLFGAVFGDLDARNINSILDTFRTLRASKQSLYDKCNDVLSGAKIPFDRALTDCGEFTDERQVMSLIDKYKVPNLFVDLRRSNGQINRELQIINNKVVGFLRANYQIPRDFAKQPSLDLSATDFVNDDFSQLDLTGFNIAGTIFDAINFNGAIIKPKTTTDGSEPGGRNVVEQPDFRGSDWWNAQSVEPTLLTFLARWYPPYAVPSSVYIPGYEPITIEAYGTKLSKLCTAAGITCQIPQKFNFPPTPSPDLTPPPPPTAPTAR